jgi:acetyltransferase-like isoleucine patch superfamily enzyme
MRESLGQRTRNDTYNAYHIEAFKMNPIIFVYKVALHIRRWVYNACYQTHFSSIGSNFKLFIKSAKIGRAVRIGNQCWIEEVVRYQGISYTPKLEIGDLTALSDAVHISCAHNISIGNGVLFGSNIYVGDHAHGYGPDNTDVPPGMRPLTNLGKISIGNRCWLCDGCVVLANTSIAPDSVVAANSVVKNFSESRPAIIAGNPAKVVKYLDL